MSQIMPTPSADPDSADMSETAVPAFARLIDVMGPIRDSGTRIAEFLGETATGPSEGTPDLSGAAQQAHAALVPLADTDMMARRLTLAARTRSVLGSLRNRSVALRAIASLSKLTARSMGSDRFDEYTDALSGKSSDLGETAERVRELLGAVTEHISSAGVAAKEALDALGILLGAIGDQPEAPDTSQADIDRNGALASAAESLQDRLHADLNGLVGLMQFSDAYAQRMAHIETLSATPVISAITHAQLDALETDTREAIAETEGRIARLSVLAEDAAGHFRADGMATAALETASLQHAALDTAVQQAASVSHAANVVRESAEVLHSSMQQARTALAALQDHCEDIELSAINSLLLARGDERTSRTMSNLAKSVGETARSTSDELAECKSLMEQLTEGSDTMATSIMRHAETLEATLSAAKQNLQTESVRADALRAGESSASQCVTELERALGDASRALDALRPEPDRLQARAAELKVSDVLPDRDAADAARSIYTMQRERDVHDAVFGIPASEAAQTETPAEEDLDDVFF